MVFVHFPLMKSLHGLRDLFPDGLRPLRGFPFKEFFPSLCVCGSGAGEDDCVAFQRLFFIVAETASVSFCALPFRLPLIAFSFLPFITGWFPFASVFR